MIDQDDDDDTPIIGAENIIDGELLAGGPGSEGSIPFSDDPYAPHFDNERAACMRELDPVVRRLVQQGRSANAIVSALAAVTVLVLDR